MLDNYEVDNDLVVVENGAIIAEDISEEARNNFLAFLEDIKKETANCSFANHTNHSNHSNW